MFLKRVCTTSAVHLQLHALIQPVIIQSDRENLKKKSKAKKEIFHAASSETYPGAEIQAAEECHWPITILRTM